ncbi:MAG: hypothetical protein KTR16_04855 [Acidiferrobacterales bacterium]|nr:hypothetical protein [Acidiferrobacterales bacterium]
MNKSGKISNRKLTTLLFVGAFFVSCKVLAVNVSSSSPDGYSLEQGLSNHLQNPSNHSSVLIPIRQAQAQSQRNSSALKSKNEVMQEVKSRYNGRVVKISLNERSQTYSVRVLLPNGKVKNLSVSAKR